jgi:hypothetical protein
MIQSKQAWVLRCHVCHGGRIYAVKDPATTDMLTSIVGDADMEDLNWDLVEQGPIDRIWQMAYCTCTEELTPPERRVSHGDDQY